MLIRRARITIERKENGWKKRREGRGGGEESWKDVDGGEREKERKRVLLHARRGEVIRLTFIAFAFTVA